MFRDAKGGRPALKTNVTAICELNVYEMWELRRLWTLHSPLRHNLAFHFVKISSEDYKLVING
jgi:hypothetical protein